MLLHSVRTIYLPAVLKLCPRIDTPERLAAIIDFTFNLGAGALRASTLRKRINAGHWSDVPYELRKWTKGGGRVLAGLVKRRDRQRIAVFVGLAGAHGVTRLNSTTRCSLPWHE